MEQDFSCCERFYSKLEVMNVNLMNLKDFIPPAILRLMHAVNTPLIFRGDYSKWEEAASRARGYESPDILSKILRATREVKDGRAIFERDSVVFNKPEYVWPLLASLMWAAARHKGKLDVLDFGGSLGSLYFQHRPFLEKLSEVRWSVIEQPHFVMEGRLHVAEGPLRFYESVSECLQENQPNIVVLSSVLQYMEEPWKVIDEINKTRATNLIIDRTPFSLLMQNRLVMQHVPDSIYSAEYPMWIFSKSLFETLISKRWRLISEISCPEGEVCTKNGLRFSFEGMLLEAME